MDIEFKSGTFELGDFPVQSGEILPDAKLCWKSFGTLSPERDNVIVYPTSFGAHDKDVEWIIGPDRILDPRRWFIVIMNTFGNGLSSSPSNNKDFPRLVTSGDNVRAQARLLGDVFGIERVACVYGWSMGAQQAYHWAVRSPGLVDSIVVNCGSARTAPHNRVFLQGLKALLEAAPEYQGNGRFSQRPQAALRAFGSVYAGWALSQEFYRHADYRIIPGMGSLQDYLDKVWTPRFAARHASDLYAHLTTWWHSDISDAERFGGDLSKALASIEARVLLLPGRSDLYFRVADNEAELTHLRRGQLSVIPSDWGHLAGNPAQNPADAAFLRKTVRAWLDA